MVKTPKYKKGDRCVYIDLVGKYDTLMVLNNNIVIEDDPYWNTKIKQWFYLIEGIERPMMEKNLRLYTDQIVGERCD
jgi:signal peptidase I